MKIREMFSASALADFAFCLISVGVITLLFLRGFLGSSTFGSDHSASVNTTADDSLVFVHVVRTDTETDDSAIHGPFWKQMTTRIARY